MANGSAAFATDTVFAAVADPTRRRMLEVLRSEECSVREITDVVDVSQSAVSQHLKVLKDAGFVSIRPEGTRNIYYINKQKLDELRAFWTNHWSVLLASLNEQED